MNLQELNINLLRSGILSDFEDNQICINPTHTTEDLDRIPSDIKFEFEKVLNRFKELIPDDFTYDLRLNGNSIQFALGYDDGPASTYFDKSVEFQLEEELTSYINTKDWDEERSKILQASNMFDDIVKLGKSFPVRIPSVQYLRKQARDQVKEYHKAMRKDKPKYSLLLLEEVERATESDYGLISYSHFKSLDEVQDFLTDAMTLRKFVVSLCEYGRPLPAKEIEELKLDVLNGLGPISRSKAEGRYQAVMNAIASEDFNDDTEVD